MQETCTAIAQHKVTHPTDGLTYVHLTRTMHRTLRCTRPPLHNPGPCIPWACNTEHQPQYTTTTCLHTSTIHSLSPYHHVIRCMHTYTLHRTLIHTHSHPITPPAHPALTSVHPVSCCNHVELTWPAHAQTHQRCIPYRTTIMPYDACTPTPCTAH